MKIQFLGTSAAGGFPNPHCRCENCVAARAAGGTSIRGMCSAIIDDELQIDLGPDVSAACMRFGLDLGGIQWVLQTHSHGDHLLPLHATARAATWAARNVPPVTWFANSHSIQTILDGNLKSMQKLEMVVDSDEPAKLTLRTIDPWQEWTFGPYRVLSIPANHASAVNPMLFAIQKGDRSMLYGSDTSALPEEIWPRVAEYGWRFDLVVFDHNDGFAAPHSPTHMGSGAVLNEYARMRSLGLVHDATRLVGTHIAHHSNSTHDVESARAQALGYDIAHDGLIIEF